MNEIAEREWQVPDTIRTDIAKELRRYTGKGTIRAKELAGFLGVKTSAESETST